jgi:tRNA modification GTPase
VISDTIAAIATPLGGEGGVGVIRISGPRSLRIIKSIFKPSSKESFQSHKIRHGWIVEKSTAVDEVMVSYMASPKTYTGEDTVEISCHGGSAVLKRVLNLTIKSGARIAEKGEFTKRAFINGKIDLTQAEAVIDIIKARTKETTSIAAAQLKGSLTSRIGEIRGQLMDLATEVEASIDFPDEISNIDNKKALKTVKSSVASIDRLIQTADVGKIYREGISIAIIGRPNVGKSSLLNALLREERAIVDEEPGTTRDIIEETLNIKGIPARVVDTAGIRHSSKKVEKLGIDRAVRALNESDLALLVIDGSEPLKKEDHGLIDRTKSSKRIIVINKSDLPKRATIKGIANISVSALKGKGIGELEELIYDTIVTNKVVAENMDVMVNLRHKEALERARELLDNSQGSIKKKMQADFIAIDIKGALAALGEVTGENVSEEVIDRIFEQFCVGK